VLLLSVAAVVSSRRCTSADVAAVSASLVVSALPKLAGSRELPQWAVRARKMWSSSCCVVLAGPAGQREGDEHTCEHLITHRVYVAVHALPTGATRRTLTPYLHHSWPEPARCIG
jgi:hypothetical protein